MARRRARSDSDTLLERAEDDRVVSVPIPSLASCDALAATSCCKSRTRPPSNLLAIFSAVVTISSFTPLRGERRGQSFSAAWQARGECVPPCARHSCRSSLGTHHRSSCRGRLPLFCGVDAIATQSTIEPRDTDGACSVPLFIDEARHVLESDVGVVGHLLGKHVIVGREEGATTHIPREMLQDGVGDGVPSEKTVNRKPAWMGIPR